MGPIALATPPPADRHPISSHERPGIEGQPLAVCVALSTAAVKPSVSFDREADRPSPSLSPRKGRKRASGEGGPFRPLFLSFSLWRRDVGTGASAPVSAPAPPLAPPRRFPVSPSPRFPVSSGLDLVVSSSHRFISTPHNEAAFPPLRASPPPQHHQPSPPSPLPVLLPLEKGLRALAFAPDHSSKRPGVCPGPLRFTDRACDHQP